MKYAAIGLLLLSFTGIVPALPALAKPQTTIAKAAVTVGMTKKQVLQIMGEPTQKEGEFWTWLTKTSGYGVTFQNGKVTRCGALMG